jgi:hypothetical protein
MTALILGYDCLEKRHTWHIVSRRKKIVPVVVQPMQSVASTDGAVSCGS